jgi:3',5'-cyclic AMP phosphodiesterase CpdA
MSIETFRLLHLSDFHIAATPRVLGGPDVVHAFQFPLGSIQPFSSSSYCPDLARAVARYAFKKANRFDALLVTGDLATTGKQGDLLPAHEYVSAPGQSAPLAWNPTGWAPWLAATGLPTLTSPGLPILLLPGNHDRFEGLFRHAGGTRFNTIFGRSWRPGNVQTIGILTLGKESLAIIAADFCLACDADADTATDGPWAHLGQGKAYSAITNELIQETQRRRQRHSPLAVVWAVHFPPEFMGLDGTLRLLDEQNLIAAAKTAGVHHLFCGHTHEPREYPLASAPTVMVHCAGSAIQYCVPLPHKNAIHPTNIEVDNGTVLGVTWDTLQWNPRRKRFI